MPAAPPQDAPLDAPAQISSSLRSSKVFALIASRQESSPRFSKWAAYYTHEAKLKSASCASCPWFLPGEAGQPAQCRLVDSTEGPDPGQILPTATCGLWNAGPVRIRLTSLIRGRGKQGGIAPGNVRYHLERVAVKTMRTMPPSDVKSRLRFPLGLMRRPAGGLAEVNEDAGFMDGGGLMAFRKDEDAVGDLARGLAQTPPTPDPPKPVREKVVRQNGYILTQ